MVVFFDTYALIEIDKENKNYKKFARSISAVTTTFNLVEVHFVYLKLFGKKEANRIYEKVKPLVMPVSDSILKEANAFKMQHRKKRLSFADCIGYVTAQRHGAPFVTGDYQFKGMEGVDFIQ